MLPVVAVAMFFPFAVAAQTVGDALPDCEAVVHLPRAGEPGVHDPDAL